jgi:mono/diheme cytochrome c family protein
MPALTKIISLVVVAAIAGISFIWFGAFNVAANDKHWGITTEFLEIVRNRSIRSRAGDIAVPTNLTDESRVQRGAANYDAMCAQCHLAPGVKTSELFEGLNPKPPVLYKDTHIAEMPAANTFWVIKNGIKMTGMPAWGIYNSDDQIWDLIATISAMKEMSPEKYQALVASGAHTHKGGGHADDPLKDKESGHHSGNENEAGHHDAGLTSNDHHGDTKSKVMTKKPSGHHDNGHAHSH